MTQTLSIPLAWCVELEKLVTPQDILRHRQQHPEQQLSFLCPECDLPIIFHPHCSGIRAHAYFIRKSGQYHQACIEKINLEYPIPQILILMQTFEDMFIRAENANKELADILKQLCHICHTLQEEMHDSYGSKELELFHLLEQRILHNKTPTVETDLQEISSIYLNLRQYLQGF